MKRIVKFSFFIFFFSFQTFADGPVGSAQKCTTQEKALDELSGSMQRLLSWVSKNPTQLIDEDGKLKKDVLPEAISEKEKASLELAKTGTVKELLVIKYGAKDCTACNNWDIGMKKKVKEGEELTHGQAIQNHLSTKASKGGVTVSYKAVEMEMGNWKKFSFAKDHNGKELPNDKPPIYHDFSEGLPIISLYAKIGDEYMFILDLGTPDSKDPSKFIIDKLPEGLGGMTEIIKSKAKEELENKSKFFRGIASEK